MNPISIIKLLIAFLIQFSPFFSSAQPSLAEIKKYKIKATTETMTDNSVTETKKTVYNIFGHDSLIYYDGKLTFYSKIETDGRNRISNLNIYNTNNNALEELHTFSYNKDGSYKIEVIAHGAGLIDTRIYNPANLLIKSKNSDNIETTYEYNLTGKLEKVFQKEEKGKKELIALTTFDKNGLELKTILYGEEESEIAYDHNDLGLIIKMRFKSSNKREVILQYDFYKN